MITFHPRGLSLWHPLKSRLLGSHTLSDHEKLEVLFKFEPLGGRKPSQMLASMLAYSPAGMEQTCSCSGYLLLYTADLAWRTGAWRPERTGCGPLTSRRLMIWWPMWTQWRSSRPRYSCPGGNFWFWWPDSLRAGSGWLWTLLLLLDSRGLGQKEWGPLLLVGKLESPGRINAVTPGFLVH